MSEPATKPPEKESNQRAMREAALRMTMTSEARERLANVRMVRPDLAARIEEYVIQLASSGRLQKPVGDEEVKQMLASMQEKKREIKIRRV